MANLQCHFKNASSFFFCNRQFKVEKSTELENWIRQMKSVLKTELSEEDSAMIRKQSNEVSANTNNEEDASDIKMDEDLYEPVDNFLKGPSHSSSETEPISEGEIAY